MRVLMVVESRHGGTTEIGAEITQVLTEAGHDVETKDADDVTHLSQFDAVVLGSAVYMGHWMPALRSMIDRLGGQLATLPLWVFWSGPIGAAGVSKGGPEGTSVLLESLGARGHREFAGRIERKSLGLGERAVAALVGAQDGDYRDFDEVRTWAGQIVADLATRRPIPG